jgi:alcohol dehydrogenase (cytochrome c)
MKPNSRKVLAGVLILGVIVAATWVFRYWVVVGARKLAGELPDVEWADLPGISHAGLSLRKLAGSGDAYVAVQNPYSSAADRAQGKQVFGAICSKCHGRDAVGGVGPPLVGRALTHGDSVWAMYRTINRGVPGTPMAGDFVSRKEAWQVIAYLEGRRNTGGVARSDGDSSARAATGPAATVSFRDLKDSSNAVGSWMLPGGSYDGQRYSRDAQIDRGNVSRLQVQWIHQFPTTQTPNETTPVVVGDYLYATHPPGTVYALNVRTGEQIWQYSKAMPPDLRLCCIAANRGVSVVGGRVYFATLDAHLIALDATSGRLLWDQKVADYDQGYSITAAPLPVEGLVITGIGGGEFPIRGFISAYDAATGALRWRFNTVPEPGQPGSETWGADSWKTGGASTWGSGAYDADLGLLYWGVGTPAPDFDASARPGDNLYSSCELALDVKTGRLVWYFQFMPHEDHDWDSTQTPSLIDVSENGTTRKLLAVANRNGFFYVLDRQTGHFVRGGPFIKQTWALGLSPSGQPIRAANTSPTPQGNFVVPSVNGATNWWPSAYNPVAGLYYVNAEEGGGTFYLNATRVKAGKPYVAGVTTFGESFATFVRALDPATARVRWERREATVSSAPRGGLLTTAGGLLFGSDGQVLYALDAATGQQLWSFAAGAHISAPPFTYRYLGKQVVAVVAGQDLLTFTLPEDPP